MTWGRLLGRLIAGCDPDRMEVELAVDLSLTPERVGGQEMDLEPVAKGRQAPDHSIQQPAIDCQGAIHIQDEVTELKVLPSGDVDVNH